MEYSVVICNVPDKDTAEKIAEHLVKKKLIACANIIPSITSIYEWKGELCKENEVMIIMKSKKDLFNELTEEIQKLHPYEVPEIISINTQDINQLYINWLSEQIKK